MEVDIERTKRQKTKAASGEATDPKPKLAASTARRKGEKRLEMPAAASAVPGEDIPAGALADFSAPAEPPTAPQGVSSDNGKGSGVSPEAVSFEGQEIELTRPTCRMQLDIGDLAADKDQHRRRQCGGAERCPACAAQQTLRDVRKACARVANVSLRVRWLLDALIVDAYQFAEGRAPKGKEWAELGHAELPFRAAVAGMLHLGKGELKLALDQSVVPDNKDPTKRRLYLYPLLRKLAPELSGGIVSALDKMVNDKWRETRFAALVKVDSSPPHYRYTLPIPLRHADLALRHVEGTKYQIGFTLRSNEARGEGRLREKEFILPLVARDQYMRDTLHALVQPNARLGAAQITEDRLRPGRWYLRIAYRRVVPLTATVRAAAINKGMVAFLVAVTEDGRPLIYDGDDIFAYLRQVQARRQRYQRQVKFSNRPGNGRKRTLRPIEPLTALGENWRNTRCQTIARRFARWLQAEGITLLYIDDFEGIRNDVPEHLRGGEWIWQRIQEWPYYKLQMALISCCEELGIRCVVRSARRISCVCPKCNASGTDVEIRRRKLSCKRCGFSRHWDVAAALNNLRFGEAERRGETLPDERAAATAEDWRYTSGGEKKKKSTAKKKRNGKSPQGDDGK